MDKQCFRIYFLRLVLNFQKCGFVCMLRFKFNIKEHFGPTHILNVDTKECMIWLMNHVCTLWSLVTYHVDSSWPTFIGNGKLHNRKTQYLMPVGDEKHFEGKTIDNMEIVIKFWDNCNISYAFVNCTNKTGQWPGKSFANIHTSQRKAFLGESAPGHWYW